MYDEKVVTKGELLKEATLNLKPFIPLLNDLLREKWQGRGTVITVTRSTLAEVFRLEEAALTDLMLSVLETYLEENTTWVMAINEVEIEFS